MSKIDEDLEITKSLDPECKQRWLPLGIKVGYKPVMQPAHDFVSSMGRIKYLQPIYQALLDTKQHAIALEWLHDNELFYHPQALDVIKKLLGVQNQQKLVEDKPKNMVEKLLEVSDKFGNFVFNIKFSSNE